MNRTLKEATVNRYYCQTHAHLQEHLATFVNACNFARRLKTLRGLTPYEFIVKTWTEKPKLFFVQPYHHYMGLYSLSSFSSNFSQRWQTAAGCRPFFGEN
jgi:hypothetical protein